MRQSMKRPNLSTTGAPARPNMAGGPDGRRLPSLDSLRAFEVPARRLSFTEAANELFVTQTAVSQRIKSLELELGAALFDRTPRGLRLTRTGEHLAHGVRFQVGFTPLATRPNGEQQTQTSRVQ
jgi:hypothetical protein